MNDNLVQGLHDDYTVTWDGSTGTHTLWCITAAQAVDLVAHMLTKGITHIGVRSFCVWRNGKVVLAFSRNF